MDIPDEWINDIPVSMTVPNGSSLMWWLEHLAYLEHITKALEGIEKSLEKLANK